MLIRKQSISAAARGFCGVGAEALTPPWRRDQVFMGGEMRVAYEHMLAKARFGGVLAIAGESGAGKSTIKDLLVSDLTEAGEIGGQDTGGKDEHGQGRKAKTGF